MSGWMCTSPRGSAPPVTAVRCSSQTTRELVGPDGLHDLGSHRLKDVGGVQLYQLGEGEFPQLKTVNRTNLPTQATPW